MTDETESNMQCRVVRWFDRQVVERGEQSLIVAVDKRGHVKTLLAAVPNETGLHGQPGAILGARLNREGRRKGWPDLCLPVARQGYHGLFIEMKRSRKKATADQIKVHDALVMEGNRVVVCDSLEKAQAVLCAYLGWRVESTEDR